MARLCTILLEVFLIDLSGFDGCWVVCWRVWRFWRGWSHCFAFGLTEWIDLSSVHDVVGLDGFPVVVQEIDDSGCFVAFVDVQIDFAVLYLFCHPVPVAAPVGLGGCCCLVAAVVKLWDSEMVLGMAKLGKLVCNTLKGFVCPSLHW